MYDHIIYISKSQESEIVSRIGDNRYFLLYENLIPERDYMPKWKKVKQDVFRIAVPGRLVNRQKNQIMALDILNKLLELGYKIEMLFIGGGKDFKMLIEYANKINVSSSVIFTDWVKTPFDYYKSVDLILFTSRYEGVP